MSFSTDPIVRIKDASIFQENQTVLSDINLELEKGELAFIIGRTGSGKSSLLKTLYADIPLRLGEISIAGYNLTKIKSKRGAYAKRESWGSSFRIFSYSKTERWPKTSFLS